MKKKGCPRTDHYHMVAILVSCLAFLISRSLIAGVLIDKPHSNRVNGNEHLALYSEYFEVNTGSLDELKNGSDLYSSLVETPFVLYSHLDTNWASFFAEKYQEEGYIENGKPPIEVTEPIDWGGIIEGDGNYTFKLNAMYHIHPFLFAYIQNGNEDYFEIALQAHKDWIKYNIDMNLENKYKWYDMSTGLRTIQLSYIVGELIKRNSDVSEIAPLLKALDLHLKNLTDPEQLGVFNHVMFQMAGIYATCNILPSFKNCQSALRYADQEFMQSLRDQYNHEGVHLEHSPTYHTWGLEKVDKLLATGWPPVDAKSLVDKAKENIIWMYHPNGWMLNIGHSEQIDMERYESYHPNVEYVLSEGVSGSRPSESVKFFKDAGYAVIRSPWDETPFSEHSYLFMTAGFHSTSHKTSDDLAFEWSEYGEVILINSGKYAYDRSDKRRYVESFLGNNTVQIVGETGPIRPDYIYGSALDSFQFDSSSNRGFIEASYNRRENQEKHIRKLSIKQREWLHVHDILGSYESPERRYIQWFHLSPDAELVSDSENKVVFYLPIAEKYLTIKDLTNENDILIAKGQTEPYLQGWYSRKLFEFEPNYAVGFTSSASAKEFRTLFYLSDSKNIEISSSLQVSSESTFCVKNSDLLVGSRGLKSSPEVCFSLDSANYSR